MEQIESSDEDSLYLTASDEEPNLEADEIIFTPSTWSVESLPVQTMTGNIEIWKFGSTSSFRTVPVRPEARQPQSRFLTSAQDMINQWDNASRVLMSCGHAITPDSLYDYCMSQMKSGNYMFTCPAIPNPDRIEFCGRQWTFDDVTERACFQTMNENGPTVVGDEWSDPQLMEYLGAKLIKELGNNFMEYKTPEPPKDSKT
ncbi:hypothetical protein KUTeg_013164 [Tegillarca granosa]|uniref:Uncharacterized protein n=1 Tax=Tegillarca granosa TaxID=220873 RepID=A0ABQ9EWY8_TEGGR|nr:hypothetical protein KUTeg_013164 [Tegillarca granosa]